jgi:hypothetical protein
MTINRYNCRDIDEIKVWDTYVIFLSQPATGDECAIDQPEFIGSGVCRTTVKARGEHEECITLLELRVESLGLWGWALALIVTPIIS